MKSKVHIRALLVSLLIHTIRALPFLNRGAVLAAHGQSVADIDDPVAEDPDDGGAALLMRALTSIFLVLLGGVFAGLTIGLMGQDEVYLQVVAESGEPHERKSAAKVLALLARGKHWVLVTLLLGNVITNETLPIVLDRLLGGGWYAVASSTVAIVIFGEIIPQSVSVRYGLRLGAFFSPYVLILMYLMAPVAYPTALILDWALGEDHGTVYKKAGLKSLVTLHRTIGVDRLNADEVTIISAVLDLKDKPVSSIMTPMQDVFVLSSDTILDEEMVEKIFLTGFNRIPIHAPRQPLNFMGMLLVRILITYDPEDCLPISSFALATLPETHPHTSCLNILNYFQEGKSHMVAVSTRPGDTTGAIGVVTLEDVIEELIGEEIVDESDVYVNVHKAIRRQTPGPFKEFKSASHPSNISKLLPSNRASNPRGTSNKNITIKRTQDGNESEDTLSHHHPSYGSTTGIISPRSKPHGRPLEDPDRLLPHANGVVTEANGSRDISVVMETESQAIESNMDALSPQGPGLPPRGSSSSEGRPRPSTDSVDDESVYTRSNFVENVVRVEGFNKVVIAEVSSDSEDEADTHSSRSGTSN